MTGAPDDETAREESPGEDEEPDEGRDDAPDADATDVIGTALGALRAMLPAPSGPDHPGIRPDDPPES